VISKGLGSKWVVVGLSSSGEREANMRSVLNSVKRILGRDLEIFIPAVSKSSYQEESHSLFYMDGYLFIQHVDGVPYIKLQDTTYFGQVLCVNQNGKVVYSLVSDSDLEPLRKGVKEIGTCKFKAGDKIKVVKGSFKNLTGNVVMVYDNCETVQVDISQRSKPMLADFPVIYLQKIANE
jgi:hypothetical protein